MVGHFKCTLDFLMMGRTTWKALSCLYWLLCLIDGSWTSHIDHISCSGYDPNAAKRCQSILDLATERSRGQTQEETMTILCSHVSAWRETEDCYLGLADRCVDRPEVADRYYRGLDQLYIYQDTCPDGRPENIQHLTECYLPYVEDARRCISVFDTDYFERVYRNDYFQACSSIEELLGCYDLVIEQIHLACPQEPNLLFETNQLLPFMEKTRDFVHSNCDLLPPHNELYGKGVTGHGKAAASEARASCLVFASIIYFCFQLMYM